METLLSHLQVTSYKYDSHLTIVFGQNIWKDRNYGIHIK